MQGAWDALNTICMSAFERARSRPSSFVIRVEIEPMIHEVGRRETIALAAGKAA
jgi:hypothetical protein